MQKSGKLSDVGRANFYTFSVGISAGTPAEVTPLTVGLGPHANLICERHLNYLKHQKGISGRYFAKLVRCGIVYATPTVFIVCGQLEENALSLRTIQTWQKAQ